jgi:hypothetical protein
MHGDGRTVKTSRNEGILAKRSRCRHEGAESGCFLDDMVVVSLLCWSCWLAPISGRPLCLDE